MTASLAHTYCVVCKEFHKRPAVALGYPCGNVAVIPGPMNAPVMPPKLVAVIKALEERS